MTTQKPTAWEKLEEFDRANSSSGLLYRYARGRVREFWNRQVVTLAGSAILALVISPATGLTTFLVVLLFEIIDCFFLLRNVRRGELVFEDKRVRFGTLFFSTLQSLSLCFCMSLGWVWGGPDFRFFVTVFLIGAVLNAGITLRYSPTLAYLRISVIATTGLCLVMRDALVYGPVSSDFFPDLVGIAMLSYITMVFVKFTGTRQERTTIAMRSTLTSEVALELSTLNLEENERNTRQLAAIAENSNDAIAIMTADSSLRWVNDTFCTTFGYSLGRVIGLKMCDAFTSEETDKQTIDQISTSLTTKKPLRFQVQLATSSGIEIWVDANLNPLPKTVKEEQTFLCVMRDITAQKASEREIKKLAEAVRNSNDGVTFRDNEGLIIWANETYCNMTGYSFRELINQSPLKLFGAHEADQQTIKTLKTAVKNHQAFQYEVFGRKKNGETIWFQNDLQPIVNQQGLPDGFVVITRNITEARATSQELKRMAALAKYSNDAVSFRNPDGTVDWINPTFTRILGYTEKDALGKIGYELLTGPDSDTTTLKKVRKSFEQKEPFRFQMNNLCKDGTYIWMDYSVTPIMDKSGEVVNYIYVGRDISEDRKRAKILRKAKQDAETAANAKSTFLATMSHEIRTPMNGIIGMSDLLLKTRLDAEQNEYVETIVSSGEALLQIINDILDFSKLDAGKLTISEHPFDLHKTLTSSLTILQPIAEAKAIKLDLDYPKDLPNTFRGDEGRIRQIVVNLVGNAIKFTSKGGVTVWCHASPKGERMAVKIAVKDTGIGIPKSKQRKIFETFSQADGDTTRKFGGTGLGLSISRLLSKQMRGDIEVQSVEGKGSTFTVTLLLGKATPDELTTINGKGKTDTVANLLDGVSILVAEDNKTNRLLVRKMLAKTGADILFAEDGEIAVDLFETMKPDIILMDVSMPNKNGIEATADIRMLEKMKKLDRTPIIALTANAFSEDREKCVASGMDGFLTKPIKKQVLIGQISGHLQDQFKDKDQRKVAS